MLKLNRNQHLGQWLYASPQVPQAYQVYQVYMGSGCMPVPWNLRILDVCQIILSELQFKLKDSGCMPVRAGLRPVAVCQGQMVRL